tara:strand:- start:197 stop:373 length:177 start_codon:yes stop_codon:yes gene_type:complete
MRVAEERLNTGFAGQLLMFGELAPLSKVTVCLAPSGKRRKICRNTLPVSSAVLVFKSP